MVCQKENKYPLSFVKRMWKNSKDYDWPKIEILTVCTANIYLCESLDNYDLLQGLFRYKTDRQGYIQILQW